MNPQVDADPALARAFAALIPGRHRGDHLHVADARRRAIRAGRAETRVPRILAGKGLRDR